MREGTVPYSVGIWTLGRPIFSRNPEIEGLLSEEILDVIQAADEVDLLAGLGGVDEANEWLDRMIETLQRRLKSLAEPCWYAKWAGMKTESTEPDSTEVPSQ